MPDVPSAPPPDLHITPPNCPSPRKESVVSTDGVDPKKRAISDWSLASSVKVKVSDAMGDDIFTRSAPLWPQDHQQRLLCMGLAYGAADNDIQELKSLLQNKADPDLKDYEHRTALHVAAGHGRLEAAKVLLESKANVNATDSMGRTPLSLCDRGGAEMEELLLKFGATVQLERIRKQAQRELWFVNRDDVELHTELGKTLKSQVFKATWKHVDVVAKICLPDSEMTAEDLNREMLHEISILSRLRHPDLVMFLGACFTDVQVSAGKSQEQIMFITQFMPGGDLEHHYLHQRQVKNDIWRPPVLTVKEWGLAVLRALAFLHNLDSPIIHRDLKPLNILLSKSLTAKVTDFGISRMIRKKKRNEGAMGREQSQKERYRMTGGVGSWSYMAPEVTRHESYTTKVDVYSFALILYFMTSGRTPFYEMGDPIKVLDMYAAGQEPRPRVEECYRPFRSIMEAGWLADATKRPSAQEMLVMMNSVETATRCAPCAQM
mmetsp:Transcript_52612/g.125676  ORF Transcript_52612/g.125676 Transcript_52612/m.125676 type:complete len:491 (+) Transcript_52612:61-1533(+)